METAMDQRIDLRLGRLARGLALPLALSALGGCAAGTASPPDVVVVDEPDPAAIRVHVEPTSAVYAPDQKVRLVAEVLDAAGEPIPDLVPMVIGTPTGHVETVDPSAAEVRLKSEGQITLEGCIESSQGPLCDDVRVWVDAGAPMLVVTLPTPGQELGADGSDEIVVVGEVEDARTVTVFVNGQAAAVTDGKWKAFITPHFGVNHLTVVASDAFGRQAKRELDVMWAAEYMAATDEGGAPKVSLPRGVELYLGQAFFDDGVPLDTSVMPLVSTDLAGILEAVVSSLDLTSSLPNPLIDMPPTLTVGLTGVTLGGQEVIVDLTDTGAELFVRIADLVVGTSGALELDSTMIDLAGGIRASVVAHASLSISKPSEDAALEVTLDGLTVAVEEAVGEFDAPEANAVFALAEGTLRTLLESQIESAIDGTLASTLPAVLGDALGALDTALQDQSLMLPAPLPSLTLAIDGRLAQIQTSYRGALVGDLALTVGVDGEATFPESRGVPLMVPTATPAPSFGDAHVGVAVQAALVNGLLHVLWNGGLLDLDVTALGGEEIGKLVKNGRIRGRMAPVVRAPHDYESYDLIFTLGQLELEGEILGSVNTYGIEIEAGVSVDIVDNAIAITVAETPEVTAWIIASEAARPLVDGDVLQGILIDQVWPALRATLMDGLSLALPLPAVDLSSVAPALGQANLELSTTESPEIVDGVLLLRGDLSTAIGATP
jgi:hypothetical protein